MADAPRLRLAPSPPGSLEPAGREMAAESGFVPAEGRAPMSEASAPAWVATAGRSVDPPSYGSSVALGRDRTLDQRQKARERL